jgi:hypothetical protein
MLPRSRPLPSPLGNRLVAFANPRSSFLSPFITLNDLLQLAIVLQRILFDLPDGIPKRIEVYGRVSAIRFHHLERLLGGCVPAGEISALLFGQRAAPWTGSGLAARALFREGPGAQGASQQEERIDEPTGLVLITHLTPFCTIHHPITAALADPLVDGHLHTARAAALPP